MAAVAVKDVLAKGVARVVADGVQVVARELCGYVSSGDPRIRRRHPVPQLAESREEHHDALVERGASGAERLAVGDPDLAVLDAHGDIDGVLRVIRVDEADHAEVGLGDAAAHLELSLAAADADGVDERAVKGLEQGYAVGLGRRAEADAAPFGAAAAGAQENKRQKG